MNYRHASFALACFSKKNEIFATFATKQPQKLIVLYRIISFLGKN